MRNIRLNTEKAYIYMPVGIAIITLAVFSPVLWADFIDLDDPVMVYANPNLHFGVTLASIYWAFSSAYEANWIPLTWISHMLDIQLFGMTPSMHHLVNLLLHTASSILLFMFFRRATGSYVKSVAIALLFALHPLHVESVAWVAERKDVLSAFFWMFALYAYVRYCERPHLSRYLTVFILFALGLLSKPMVVTFPVILLLLDWWPLGRISSAIAGGNRISAQGKPMFLLVEKIPFFVLSAGSSAITYIVQHTAGEIVYDLTLLERIARACISYCEYLYKAVWPSGLAVFYPFVEASPSSMVIALSVLLLLLITYSVIRSRNRYPFLLTGWFWYIISLLPVIGLIQIGQHSIADRYTYIPLIGFFIIIVWLVSHFFEKQDVAASVVGVVSLCVLCIMSGLTWMQLQYWKNSKALLTHAIEVTENNWLALNNLGLEYLREGRVDDALWLFNESVKAKPSYVLALLNLGAAYSMKNQPDFAIDAFNRALRYDQGNEKAHLSLGLIYLQIGDIELAKAEYEALHKSGSLFAPHLLKDINTILAAAPKQ